jgi:hypothetical protein
LAAGLSSKTTILVFQQNLLGSATDFPHEIWKISVASWAIVSVQNFHKFGIYLQFFRAQENLVILGY